MNNFKELCDFNADVERARHEVCSLIRRVAVSLVADYEKSLDLPAPHWVDEHGKHAYVEVGQLMDGEFTPCTPQPAMTGGDCVLTMAVKTAVGSDSDTQAVPVAIHLRLVSADDAGFEMAVTINEDRPIRVIAASTADEHAYTDVLVSMKKHIVQQLQRRYPRAYLQ